MSKVVLYIAMSLDGFIAGRNDDITWLYRFNDVDYGFREFFSGIGAMIQGRRAYEIEVQNGWATPHPVPTFVLAHHFQERKPQREEVIFTAESIEAVLTRAKRLTTKDIWIEGGANVAQQFLNKRLIDELALFVVPMILGDGIRLFGSTHAPVELSFREAKTFEKGLVQLVYARE